MRKSSIIPYIQLARMHRPIGSLLLLWPTLMALWLANRGIPPLNLLVIFGLGVFFMRSAGCIANDLADQKFDAFVKRTKSRPLVRGQISPKQASLFLVILLLCSFILVLFTNLNTILISFIALGLALFYPFCKRFTYLPQFVLGAAFAMAIPMAYAASNQPLNLTCGLLFLATTLWAVAYDTIYAMVDIQDDVKIGVKSTAILFGQYDKALIGLHHGVVLLLFVIIAQLNQLHMSFWFFIILAMLSAGYQQILIKERDEQACFHAFLHNNWFGLILFLGVCVCL